MTKPGRTPQCPTCGWPVRNPYDDVPRGTRECGRCRELIPVYELTTIGGDRR